MAVSGLIMIGYLIAHMYGNLKVFAGAESFNTYAHHLRTLGEPILPYAGALWVLRVVLIASILVHVYAAFRLWARANHARGGAKRYQTTKTKLGVQRTYASFTLRWGGVIILLFVIYHLLHLTFNTIHPGGAAPDPYQRFGDGIPFWWAVLSYSAAVRAVGAQLRHGRAISLPTFAGNSSRLRGG